jgi:hypothetical protein
MFHFHDQITQAEEIQENWWMNIYNHILYNENAATNI